MKIIISADLVPTQSNYELFEKADTVELFGEKIIDELKSADIRIFNLEVPLYDGHTPITKAGPVIKIPSSAFVGIKALEPSLLSIGNNHILDHGEKGLKSTVEILSSNEISFVGAGKDLSEAKKPYIFERGGKKIGVYSCAEHEFSIATENSAGANPFDPLYSLDEIAELKSQVDFVIVLFHGGRELYRYPTPMQQKRCRRMIEKGADLVVCQHSHCVGCEEKYKGGTIVYGQGNFIFDYRNDKEWETGMLVEIEFSENNDTTVSYFPFNKIENKIRADESGEILKGFEERSAQIQKEGFVEESFSKEADNNLFWLLQGLLGKIGRTFLFRAINKIFKHKLVFKFYTRGSYLGAVNHMECETHRELFLQGLKNKIRGK